MIDGAGSLSKYYERECHGQTEQKVMPQVALPPHLQRFMASALLAVFYWKRNKSGIRGLFGPNCDLRPFGIMVKSVLATGHWPLELTTDHQATNFDHQTPGRIGVLGHKTPEQPQ